MKNVTPANQIFRLGFMTIWITFWSLAVGFISGGVARGNSFLILFLITHGGAEIFVARMIMKEFTKAAQGLYQAPELSQDLDSMSATWRSKPHVLGLLIWCFLLGFVVLAILLIGTWLPVLDVADGSASPYIPILLTCFWGYVAWTWSQALRSILLMLEKIRLISSFDHLTIKRQGLFLRRDIDLPISGLEVTADETAIVLRSGDEDLTLNCPPSPERARLLENLSQSIQRAENDPVSQPELPKALAEMLGETP